MRKSKSNAMLRGLAASALVLMVSATAWGQKVKSEEINRECLYYNSFVELSA